MPTIKKKDLGQGRTLFLSTGPSGYKIYRTESACGLLIRGMTYGVWPVAQAEYAYAEFDRIAEQ